jgi:hypothetical protein
LFLNINKESPQLCKFLKKNSNIFTEYFKGDNNDLSSLKIVAEKDIDMDIIEKHYLSSRPLQNEVTGQPLGLKSEDEIEILKSSGK